MSEFIVVLREQARERFQTVFHEALPNEIEPLSELITRTLENGGGGVSPTSVPVTDEQWMLWNRLRSSHPWAIERTLAREVEREAIPIPEQPSALPGWAAQMLLATLDRLGMG